MNYENVPAWNLKTIKAEMNSGRMNLEAMKWLVEELESERKLREIFEYSAKRYKAIALEGVK